jgi:hypothetical protein
VFKQWYRVKSVENGLNGLIQWNEKIRGLNGHTELKELKHGLKILIDLKE